MVAAVTSLTRDIMTLQAEGSYQKAKAMHRQAGRRASAGAAVLDRLTSVPVDIEPKFTTAATLLREESYEDGIKRGQNGVEACSRPRPSVLRSPF